MAKLIVSPQAALDAAAIVELLSEKAGIDVAARYLRQIDALFERISLFPRSGMRRPSLGRDIRGRRNITRRLVRE